MSILSNIVSRWKMYWMRKRIARMRNVIEWTIIYRLRMQLSLPRPREDKFLDRAVDKAVRLFFTKGPCDHMGNDLGKTTDHSEDISSLIEQLSDLIYERLCNDATAKSDLDLCLRAWHLHYALSNDASGTCFIAQKYQSFFKKKITPLNVSTVSEKYLALKTRLKSTKHAFRNSVRTRQARDMRRINIKLKDLTPVISAISVVFFFAGYMHISIVYGHFGIDASQFFSLDDYLANSTQQIRLALLAIIGYALALVRIYRHINEKEGFILPQHTISSFLWFRFEDIAFFAFLYMLYVHVPNAFWALAPVSVIILGNTPVALLAIRFFNNPFPVFATVMLLLIFFASILAQSYRVITNIEKEHEQNIFLVESVDQKFTNENFIFLGKNDRYIFLLEKNSDAKIIPMRNIKKITMSDTKPPGLLARASAFFLAR